VFFFIQFLIFIIPYGCKKEDFSFTLAHTQNNERHDIKNDSILKRKISLTFVQLNENGPQKNEYS